MDLKERKVPPTQRPNGAWYRPRKPLRVQSLMWNDDGWVVMVYGTHDPTLARSLAEAEWAAEQDGDLPEPRPCWVKTVPWDPFGYGWDRTVMEVPGTTKGSTPALQYGGGY